MILYITLYIDYFKCSTEIEIGIENLVSGMGKGLKKGGPFYYHSLALQIYLGIWIVRSPGSLVGN